MDNNFNQHQAPQNQQVPQNQQMPQQPYQQAPQQPMYQQMPQNQQIPYQQAPQQPYQQPPVPKKPSKNNMTELIAFICSVSGAFLSVIGSILTCSCSAAKTYDTGRLTTMALGALSGGDVSLHATSAVMLVALLGAIASAVGIVFAIKALKDKNAEVKAGKMAYIAVAVGVFGVLYGILPALTICGYNCSLNSNFTDMM